MSMAKRYPNDCKSRSRKKSIHHIVGDIKRYNVKYAPMSIVFVISHYNIIKLSDNGAYFTSIAIYRQLTMKSVVI